jgi:hypothetical protein
MTIELQTFRDTLRRIVPPWLRRGTALRLLYSFGVVLDACADATVAGVKLRFPGYLPEALPLLGRERRIARGRNEPDDLYAPRLMRWLVDHRMRGGPYAMLAQLYAHYASAPIAMELQYRSGRRFRMAADGTIARDIGGWNDGDPAQWARWILRLYLATPSVDGGTWDGDPGARAWNDPTTVWDYEMSPEDVADYTLIPREWNAAHCIGVVELVPTDIEQWDDPAHTWDTASGRWNGVVSIQLAVGGS